MATTAQSIAVGVFEHESQAKNALDELHNAGFSDDQIDVSRREGGLFSLFTRSIRDNLVKAGISEAEADYYEREFEAGRIIETVRAGNRQQEAINILRRNGGYDATNGPLHTDTGETRVGEDRVIPVREEQLQVHKQWVEAGHVLIRKRVITEEKTIKVTVAREEVVIERYPLPNQAPGSPTQSTHIPSAEGQPIGAPEAQILKLDVGQTITIPVREEQIIVNKQPVVIEEIVLSKQAIEETQRVADTIQREEPRIERMGDVNIRGNDIDVADLPQQVANRQEEHVDDNF